MLRELSRIYVPRCPRILQLFEPIPFRRQSRLRTAPNRAVDLEWSPQYLSQPVEESASLLFASQAFRWSTERERPVFLVG